MGCLIKSRICPHLSPLSDPLTADTRQENTRRLVSHWLDSLWSDSHWLDSRGCCKILNAYKIWMITSADISHILGIS